MMARTNLRTVPELFEAVAAQYAQETAVVYKDTTLSYQRLNERANKLARLLVARGVGPDSLVAVAVPRSPELLVALLAVLKAGGAYLPLDPRYPAARKAFMIEDCAPVLLVRAGSDQASDTGLDEIDLGSSEYAESCAALGAGDLCDGDRLGPLTADSLMYVIYTSGSTGTPKGVAVTHEGVADLATTQALRFHIGCGDRILQWASISFDAGFWDITLALLHGSTLIMADDADLLPGDALRETLLKHEVDHAVLPPAALSITDSAGVLLGGTIMSTGDACTPTLLRKWSHGRRMFNGYGPTEVTVGATIAGPVTEADGVNIGVPFTGSRVYVLDERLRPVPDGEEGELFLGGSGVARGYLNRPGLTAAIFLPDPFGPPGSRMYRSGDLGRRDADGTVHFLGRVDRQVKLRGFRIELGEIDACLARQPDVDLAATLVEGDLADGSLAAYVKPRKGMRIDTAVLRKGLAAELPEYMVPGRITVLDHFPTTANGKIDRGALAAAGRAAQNADTPPQPAFTPHHGPDAAPEDRLRAIVAGLLGTPTVDLDENFFELGGNSLLAARMIARVREELGVRLPIRGVLGAATLRDIARLTNPQHSSTDRRIR